MLPRSDTSCLSWHSVDSPNGTSSNCLHLDLSPQCFSSPVDFFHIQILFCNLHPTNTIWQPMFSHLPVAREAISILKRRKMLNPSKGICSVMYLFISRCLIWKQSSIDEHETYLNYFMQNSRTRLRTIFSNPPIIVTLVTFSELDVYILKTC